MGRPLYDNNNDDGDAYQDQDDDDIEGGGGGCSIPFADELSFLTVDYISDLMRFDTQQRLVLDMSTQYSLFEKYLQRQPSSSQPSLPSSPFDCGPNLRKAFIERMVLCILHHPLGDEVRHFHLSGLGCGDDFIVEWCQQTINNPRLMLPKLEILDVETNQLSDIGLLAIANVLTKADPIVWTNLTELRVNNNINKNNNNHRRRDNMMVERAFCEAIVERAKWSDRHNNNDNGEDYCCSGITKFNLEFQNPYYRETTNAALFHNLDMNRRGRVAKQQQQLICTGDDNDNKSISDGTDSDVSDKEGSSLLQYILPCCRFSWSSSSSISPPSLLSPSSWARTIRPSPEKILKTP